MKILFSYPLKVINEAEIIHQEMNMNNWDLFHLRKPNWKVDDIEKLLRELSGKVRRKVVIHGHLELVKKFHLKGGHLKRNELSTFYPQLSTFNFQLSTSCHSFGEVEKLEGKLAYCFLSPIFDSISKQGYKAKFNKNELKEFLSQKRKTKIIALGGITATNYNDVLKMGFDGGAFLGSIWNKYLFYVEQNFSEK